VALTISAMSTLTSISASFGTGLMMGGPAICVWGWIGERRPGTSARTRSWEERAAGRGPTVR
jgi:hypothetical protein